MLLDTNLYLISQIKKNIISHGFLKGMKNIALLYLIGKKDQNRNRFYKNATNYVSDISDVGLSK